MRISLALALAVLLLCGEAHAYVGPGLGLGAIGAALGFILAVFAAFVAVFWYPLKRMFRKRRNRKR